jgi:chaperone modulatory protein CbpM
MMTWEELRRRIADVDAKELDRWVEKRWVRPDGQPGAYFFREIDVARARLIAEMRELQIGDEALPLVLSLLDQLYAARRQLHLLREAIATQPDQVRSALLGAVLSSTDEERPVRIEQ